LCARHLAEHVESGGGAAGHNGGFAKKFTPRDDAAGELFRENFETPVHALLLWRPMVREHTVGSACYRTRIRGGNSPGQESLAPALRHPVPAVEHD
jgi:hypothetical protein